MASTSSQRRYLVVGAGFTGAVMAEQIASRLGRGVLLIDRRDHVAGNAFDYVDEAGVLVHRHGPHIFHTNAPRIVDYLSSFTAWRPYEHRVLGFVDGQMTPVPFNLTSMEMVFGAVEGARLNKLLTDEYGVEVKVPILKLRQSASGDIRKLADTIYEKIFLDYTVKQWGLTPEALDPGVTARVPVNLSRDDRYFADSFQSMPADGFTALFRRMLDHPLIEVQLGQAFEGLSDGERFEKTVFTGPIDEYFGGLHGVLPYRSQRFELVTHPGEGLVQARGTHNFPTPASRHPFTRSTEFRHLTGQTGVGATTVAFEYSEAYVPGVNEPYYPIPREANRAIFRRYEAEAAKLKAVIFAGRLADYSYYNMDQAVARALSVFEKHLLPGG